MDNTHHHSLGPMHGVRASQKVALWRLLMRKIPGQERMYAQSSSASVLVGGMGGGVINRSAVLGNKEQWAKGKTHSAITSPFKHFNIDPTRSTHQTHGGCAAHLFHILIQTFAHSGARKIYRQY